MNNILFDQNNKEFIDLLFIQRKLYTNSKQISNLIFVITLLFIIVNIEIGYFKSLHEYKTYFTVFFFLWLFRLYFLKSYADDLKHTAAKIQELFDIRLFNLEWNDILDKSQPSEEFICSFLIEQKKEYSQNNIKALKEWYICDNNLTIENARIICQKQNVGWDRRLRDRFQNFNISIVSISIIVYFIMLIYYKTLIVDFFYYLFPFASFLYNEYSLIIKNIEVKKSYIDLNEKIDEIIDNISNQKINAIELSITSRKIQDKIFSLRKNNVFIPDYFYKWFKTLDDSISKEQITKSITKISK